MTVSLVRLISGEDILTKVSFPLSASASGISDEAVYTLKRPMRIIAQPDQTGKVSVGFADYPPFGTVPAEDLEVLGNKILYITKPNKQLIDAYTRMVSDIIVPRSSDISLA